MSDTLPYSTRPPALAVPRRGVLIWIAIYKIVKAAMTFLAAVAVIELRGHDLTRMLIRAVHYVGIAPDSRLATQLIAHAAGVNNKQLGEFGAGLALYALLYFIEGLGLYFQKSWAEWLIVVTSSLLLPLELYEVHKHVTVLKIVVLLTNAAIIAYLIWRINREKKLHRLADSATAAR